MRGWGAWPFSPGSLPTMSGRLDRPGGGAVATEGHLSIGNVYTQMREGQIMDNLLNSVARRRRRGQRGFTLIELLVVIAVLAILAAIVIFNVLGVTNRGNQSSCQTDTKSVQTASDAYRNDTGNYANGTGATNAGASNATVAAQPIDLSNPGPLVPAYLHTVPGNGESFTYSDTSGTVAGSGPNGC